MSHLSKTEIESIRAELHVRREALLKQLRHDLEQSGDTQYAAVLGRSSGDSSDEALAVTLGDLAAARMHHEMRQLGELDSALARLGAEDFGECVDCGAAIPSQRLIVYPAATRCVACQGLFEKTHAHQPHGSL